MRRFMAVALLSAIITLGTVGTAAPVSAGGRVFCRVPTLHKVVCYNYTPYAVDMSVRVNTSAGPRFFNFTHRYTRWVKYFAPVVYNVRWHWSY